ncbi:MAG TPA: fluoride efflux transporter CrcB [Polyangiaceae bacterium]|nr:fluoride efflux transporter CrcB [Polyangiaceae bacterium]
MERFFWICFAGALGTAVRYLVSLWAAQRLGTNFPYGTLIVNVTGCFLIALVMSVALRVPAFPTNLRFALTTGFMGGLTTYSSFNYETTRLLQEGSPRLALVNYGVTGLCCFAAGVCGLLLGARWVRP